MARFGGRAFQAVAGVASLAALALPLTARALSGASAGTTWLVPVLVALAALALVALVLRAPAASAGTVVCDGERQPSALERSSVFVVTRDARDARRGDAAAAHAAPAFGAPPPAVDASPPPDSALRRLSALMDDVAYEPGSPNVLSMTKRIGGAAGAEAPAVSWTRSDRGDEAVLEVSGAIDTTTVAGIRGALDALPGEGRRTVTLDLSGVSVMDAAGVAAFASMAARARARGAVVRVVGLGRQPHAMMKLFRLDQALRAS